MSELAPEALVPDAWRCEAARCGNCGREWHALARGECETSCLNLPVVPRLRMPLLWDGDCA